MPIAIKQQDVQRYRILPKSGQIMPELNKYMFKYIRNGRHRKRKLLSVIIISNQLKGISEY